MSSEVDRGLEEHEEHVTKIKTVIQMASVLIVAPVAMVLLGTVLPEVPVRKVICVSAVGIVVVSSN